MRMRGMAGMLRVGGMCSAQAAIAREQPRKYSYNINMLY